MGNSRYDEGTYRTFTHSTTDGRSRVEIFKQGKMHEDLDPSKFAVRECVDSPANPNSTPIILASDVTGSMGHLAEQIMRGSLGDIMKALYDREPVPDPQILVAGVGDASVDDAPLQVSQFEADGVVLASQLQRVWLEAGGGGNPGESYPLVWGFAHFKTSCAAFAKHRKGYIFTIGDEAPLETITNWQWQKFLAVNPEQEPPTDAGALLALVREHWNVFHLIIKPVGHQPVVSSWFSLLGENAIEVDNAGQLTEAVVSCIQVAEGQDPTAHATGDAAVVAQRIFARLPHAATASQDAR